jgi:hypothetical protein
MKRVVLIVIALGALLGASPPPESDTPGEPLACTGNTAICSMPGGAEICCPIGHCCTCTSQDGKVTQKTCLPSGVACPATCGVN